MERFLARAKRKDNGEWVEGYVVPFPHSTVIYYETSKGLMLVVDVIPETVCQYTGKTDVNDKKVYEHDMVHVEYIMDGYENENEIVEVQWSGYDCGFSPFNWEYDCDGCCGGLEITRIEIIGNTFDDKDEN